MGEKLKGVFSHESDEWATPQTLFDELNAEFEFNLDPCATEENHKCETYYTEKENGLDQDWGGKRVFATRLIHGLQNGSRNVTMKAEKKRRSSPC